MTMKEQAAKRIQEEYGLHTEVTVDGEYIVDTVSAGYTARNAERVAKRIDNIIRLAR